MWEPPISLDDAGILLRCTSRTLFKTVDLVLPELKVYPSPTGGKPRKGPPATAAAHLVLKEVRESLADVNFAVQNLESAIKKEDDSRLAQTDISLKTVPS